MQLDIITADQSWADRTSSLVSIAQQHLYFLFQPPPKAVGQLPHLHHRDHPNKQFDSLVEQLHQSPPACWENITGHCWHKADVTRTFPQHLLCEED